MSGFDLFESYRFILATVAGSYVGVQLTLLVIRLSGLVEASIPSAIVRRYLIVLFLRLRFRRFLFELTVVGGLVAALVLLIGKHRG